MNKGYRAFLFATATDLPCRGMYLRDQRREDVDAAAGLSGVLTGRRRQSGVSGQPNGQRKHNLSR